MLTQNVLKFSLEDKKKLNGVGVVPSLESQDTYSSTRNVALKLHRDRMGEKCDTRLKVVKSNRLSERKRGKLNKRDSMLMLNTVNYKA